MNSNIEPPKETSNPPPPPPLPAPAPSSFSSLPEDIVLCILALISASYYPKLSLVSKSFRSLILSKDLENKRRRLKTREECVYICLQSRTHPCDPPRWFSLWIKPDDHQTLTHSRWFGFWVEPDVHQTLTYCMSEDKSTGNLLVPMPSSYSPYLPRCYEVAGSEIYEIGGGLNPPSSTKVRVSNELNGEWREAPSMLLARKNAFTCSVDEKIYVMGGCEADETTCWGEVFDPKTQTWEPLPDPGTKLRYSSIKNLDGKGDIYVRTDEKNYVYLVEESRWEVVEGSLGESVCGIENIWYLCANDKCWWRYGDRCEEWRLVKGLTELDYQLKCSNGMEIVSCGGKLVIFWVGPLELPLRESDSVEIWCAVILLERRHDDEIWGHIEWVDLVLRVPWSHTLLRCVVN